MISDKEKMPVLLEHWIEHNSSHEEEFEKWAQRAREAGMDQVADDVCEAAQHVRARFSVDVDVSERWGDGANVPAP